MKLQWLRPFLVLAAAAIISISSIVMKRPVLISLIWLLAAIIVFYILGSIMTGLIEKAIQDVPQKDIVPEDIDLNEENGESETQEKTDNVETEN
jgi:predicted membrane channel-forming protein YqfA (hemolysin III family)